MTFIRDFFVKHRTLAIIFLACFVFKLVFLFIILRWDVMHPGIENSVSYKTAQPAYIILAGIHFFEPNNGHPPAYYAFAASIKYIFGANSIWLIFFIQDILISMAAVLVYKLGKMFFSASVGFGAAIIFGIEPYLSFEMNTLVSEGLFVFFFTFAVYFFALFFEKKLLKHLVWAAIFLGLSALTRATTLYFPLIPATFFIWYVLKKAGWRVILKYLLVFYGIFILLVAPWMVRNKIVTGNFSLGSNFSAENIYYYNIPTLLSAAKHISYQEALDYVTQKEKNERPANQSRANFYQSQIYQIVARYPFLYAEVHLVKTVPFFLQSGYEDMMAAFSVKPAMSRPDITLSLIKGDWRAAVEFFGRFDFYNYVYFIGLGWWGLVNLFAIIGLYFCVRRKKSLIFMAFSVLTVFYLALPTGTIALARYRLPVYSLFFIFAVFGYLSLFGQTKKAALEA